MKRLIALLMCIAIFLTLCAGCEGLGKETKGDTVKEFSVGYAKADITPKLEWDLGLVGFNDQKTRRGTGVLTPLEATCTAFSDAETTVVLISWDLLHSTQELTFPIREAITEELGIEGKYIQFTADHTHSGPNTNIGADPDVVFYYNFMIDTCVEMVRKALEDRKPAKMYTSFCRPEGLNFQRYYILKDGTHIGRTGNPSDSYYGHMATVDNMMQILKFTREGGKDVVLVNWGSHYRGTGEKADYTKYTANFFGVMRDELSAMLGCETMYVQAATGDVAAGSELSWERTKDNEDFYAVGQNLAKHAAAAMENMQEAEIGKITLTESIFHITTNPMDYYLYAFGFGDVGFVMAPYEMFQSNSIKIRNESPYKMTFIGTLANASDNKFYLPDAEAYHAENPYGVSAKYVEGDSEIFHEEYMRLLNETFTAGGQTEPKEKDEGYITDRSPKKDEKPYTNPAPGADNLITPVKNNLFQMNFLCEGKLKLMLVEGEELANKLAQMETFYAILDKRMIIVDIAE